MAYPRTATGRTEKTWKEFEKQLLERGMHGRFALFCGNRGATLHEVYMETRGGAHVLLARYDCLRYQLSLGWSQNSVATFWRRDRASVCNALKKTPT